jgi:hypothetical protein
MLIERHWWGRTGRILATPRTNIASVRPLAELVLVTTGSSWLSPRRTRAEKTTRVEEHCTTSFRSDYSFIGSMHTHFQGHTSKRQLLMRLLDRSEILPKHGQRSNGARVRPHHTNCLLHHQNILPERVLHELDTPLPQIYEYEPNRLGSKGDREAESRARKVSDERERAASADRLSEGEQTPRGNVAEGGVHACRPAACDDAATAEPDTVQQKRNEDRRKRRANGSRAARDDDRRVLSNPLA